MTISIENTLANAAGGINEIRKDYGSASTIFRMAAHLAAIQLDRPISPQDVARIAACIQQAKIAMRPDVDATYGELAATLAIAASLPMDTIQRPNVNERLEESLDEAGRRIAKAFAPSLPKVEPTE